MSDDPSSIGLQHPAFAVSKVVLLQWIEDTFQIKYAKVEEVASGAFYCQVLDYLYPGQMRMNLVNWNSKLDYDWIGNFKLVQTLMVKNNISKPVPIDKLVKAKYQDNLEFLQWFKHFFECRAPSVEGQEYDAPARRALAKSGGPKGMPAPKKPAAAAATPATPAKVVAAPKPVAKPEVKEMKSPKPAEVKESKTVKPTAVAEKKAAIATGADDAELAELTAKIQDLQATTDGLEQERDFYYGKLREVEILCQDEDTNAFSKDKVLAILYKTEDGATPAAAAAVEDETL
jgi:RP/EB family microtubule-associated protein